MNAEKQTDDVHVESTIPNAEPASQEAPHQFIDVHVYDLPPGVAIPPEFLPENETKSVEGTLTESKPLPEWEQPDAQSKRQRRKLLSLMPVCIVVGILLMAGGSIAYVLLFLQDATVTIIPTTRKAQTTDTLTLSTHADVPDSIPGRVLPSITMSQAQTVATTGHTQQEARPGRGTITFYNAGTEALTLVAGTLITGKDGVQVVTDSSITVPAVLYPTLGQATVAAHSVQVGPSGNIAAGDIYGPCCLLTISAVNGAFSGGQEASVYQSVAKPDIETAVRSLQASLTESVTAALQTQVQSSETLISPPMCESHTSTDHQTGDKATQVQVSVSETCMGLTYDTKAMQAKVSRAQTMNHYHLLGNPRTVIQNITAGKEPGTYTLSVQGTAIWVYQFSQRELETLAGRIAGKSTRDATKYLLQTVGVQQVSFSSSGTLPSDVSKIHFLFLTQQ
jgi:hypothetical protein